MFFKERKICPELLIKNFHNTQDLKGNFIQLPRFEKAGDEDILPKGYVENTRFFFSSQHYHILHQSFQEKSKPGVRVIIGPHGIGKTSFAFINKFPLIYIPHCSEWAKMYDKDLSIDGKRTCASLYFLQRFKLLNDDLNFEIMKDVDKILSQDKNISPYNVYREVLKLKNLFVILDDHNELWNYKVNNEPFFREWIKWSSAPKNVWIFVSGSAHTEYLSTNIDMEDKYQFYIIPIQEKEVLNFINEESSPCYLPQYSNDIKRLEHLTGFVRRYMVWLKTFKKEEDYIRATIEKIRRYASEYFKKLELNEPYLSTLENMIFSKGLDGSIYDTGLVYQSYPGSFPTIINLLAQRILTILFIHQKYSS